jgi:hypothetical protein
MLQKLKHSHILFIFAAGCSTAATATDWDIKFDNHLKYYDASESYREFYFGDNMRGPNFTQFEFSRAILPGVKDGVDMKNLCYRVNALTGRPGLFKSKATIDVYYVNLTKIASVESIGRSGTDKDPYFTEMVKLRDGTKFETVNFDNRYVLACGMAEDGNLKVMPQQWVSFSSYQEADCSYDEARMDRSKWPYANLSKVFAYGRPSNDVRVYLGFNQLGKGWTTTFDTDQAALAAKFEQCSSGSAKYLALEKAQAADQKTAYEARQRQQELEQQERARRQQELQAKLLAEAVEMRKTIAIGTRTNCGLVFDIKKPMIGVQTMMGMQYIHVDQLWGPSSDCHFRNGVYTGPTR